VMIKTQNLTKTYGDLHAIDDLSIELDKGDLFGYIGPNGSGKTTLMKVMAGMVQPDTGQRSVPPGISVGYKEQEPDMSGFDTLGEFAASGLDPMESYKVEMAAEGLKFDPETTVDNASGGERRRVEITRALVLSPYFLLLDEPFAGIDPIAVADIQLIVRRLKEKGIGILITDHNVRETLGICDRAYILSEGKVIARGPPRSISRSRKARQVFLGENFKL
ncbi:hypothetical protein LCGC14_2596530, partial [marine sediment metagenome]